MLESVMDCDPPAEIERILAPNLTGGLYSHKTATAISGWLARAVAECRATAGALAMPRPAPALRAAAAANSSDLQEGAGPSDRPRSRAAARRSFDAVRRFPRKHGLPYRRPRNKARGCARDWRRLRAKLGPDWKSGRAAIHR